MWHQSLLAALTLLPVALAQVSQWGQCGGIGYTGSKVCVSPFVCFPYNPYYSECIPPTSSSTTAKTTGKPSTTITKTTSTSTSTSPTVSPTAWTAGEPYAGYTVYLSPFYASEVAGAVANITARGNATLAAAAAAVAKVPTFIWFDEIAKVPDLATYLADARAQATATGKKYLVQIVVYDLPDRDCAAYASNGELTLANNGTEKYMGFIDSIAAIIDDYPDIRVVISYEPDSLANLVTNLNIVQCQLAQSAYESLSIYAWQKLNQPNVYLYVDAGHAGWLGYTSNSDRAAPLFGSLLAQAGNNTRVVGCATNVANYNALYAATPDPITDGDLIYDELKFITAFAVFLEESNFPARFIVDQSRSGVQDIRDDVRIS